MKNLLIVATSALCVLIAIAVPLPEQDVQIVQIPLEGNKELDILSLPENNEGQLTERNKRTIGVLRQLFPELSKMTSNGGNGESSIDLVALSERLESINRVVRNTAGQAKAQLVAESKSDKSVSDDTNTIATAINDKEDVTKASDVDDFTIDGENDDENRNKRFLSFGFGGSGSNGSGGSGNFLFDIIRLVGGSAGTEQTDERENAPDGEATVAKNADGYTEGIPGPVTRLFVLANRGLANLIQDLILRIAQTSERVVNFKARLITSLI